MVDLPRLVLLFLEGLRRLEAFWDCIWLDSPVFRFLLLLVGVFTSERSAFGDAPCMIANASSSNSACASGVRFRLLELDERREEPEEEEEDEAFEDLGGLDGMNAQRDK